MADKKEKQKKALFDDSLKSTLTSTNENEEFDSSVYDTLTFDESEEMQKKPKWGVKIILTLVAVIVVGAVVFYAMNPQKWSDKEANHFFPGKQEKETRTNVPEEFEPNTVKKVTSEEKEILFQNVETEPEKTNVMENPTAMNLLERPCYIISFGAFSTKEIANEETKNLSGNGFACGNFFIPDYQRGGKKLHKVFVGPFDTRNEAEKVLPKVKKVKSSVYIQKLEAQ